MAKKLFGNYGINVYPSPTAGRGQRIGETPLRRCVQCGTPNDVRHTAWSYEGDGLSLREGSSPPEWDVTGGCKFCGSFKWLKRRPKLLPDDRYAPAPENLKHRR